MKWLFLFSLLVVLLEAKKQTVKVKGTTICGTKRHFGATVELWEYDAWDPDDLIISNVTNKWGAFDYVGSTEEVWSIDPYILIKHNCRATNEKCTRHSRYSIPKKYINVEDIYDMGYINLANSASGHDKEKCPKN